MNVLRYSILFAAVTTFGADTAAPPVAKIFDQQLTSAEKEIVGLAEAMPADKYNFAPTSGEFKGVRTFGLQVTHIATVIYEVSASVLSERVCGSPILDVYPNADRVSSETLPDGPLLTQR